MKEVLLFSKWKNYNIILSPKRRSLSEGGYDEGRQALFSDHLLRLDVDKEEDAKKLEELKSNAFYGGDFWLLENNIVPTIVRSASETTVSRAPAELAKDLEEQKQQAKEAAQEKRMGAMEDMIKGLTDVVGTLAKSLEPKKEKDKPPVKIEEDKV